MMEILLNVVYSVGGFVILFLNSLIVVAILKARSLRHKKEYLVVVGLSVADAVFGFNYFWIGLHRLYLISTNQEHVLISVWDCMKKPRVIVMLYGVQLASVMLVCISVDRLLAVSVPIWYFKQRSKYAYRLVTGFYLLVFINCSALVYVSYTKRNTDFCPQTCMGGRILGKGMATEYSIAFRMVCGVLSVFLYILIPFIYRRRSTTMASVRKEKIETQKKLMKTLGISSVFTFSFYILPNLVKILLVDLVSADVWTVLGPSITCLTLINPMANFFLYTLRHKDMRKAILELIPGCKPKNNAVVPIRPAARRIKPNNDRL